VGFRGHVCREQNDADDAGQEFSHYVWCGEESSPPRRTPTSVVENRLVCLISEPFWNEKVRAAEKVKQACASIGTFSLRHGFALSVVVVFSD
jgi:hypothetical protein